MLHPDQLTIMDFLALVGEQSGRWPYPQWPDPWWSKHRQYRSWDIIRELRRECCKAGHYLAIILPKHFLRLWKGEVRAKYICLIHRSKSVHLVFCYVFGKTNYINGKCPTSFHPLQGQDYVKLPFVLNLKIMKTCYNCSLFQSSSVHIKCMMYTFRVI